MGSSFNNMEYKIIERGDRFIIVDESNILIDDCRGFGYKTYESAKKGLWWISKGQYDLKYIKKTEHIEPPEEQEIKGKKIILTDKEKLDWINN